MAHLMTQNQYKELRDNRYTVISFKDGKRMLTYAGLSIPKMLDEVTKRTDLGQVVKVYNFGEEPNTHSWNIEDYQ